MVQTNQHCSWPSRQARQTTAGFSRQHLAYYTPLTHFMAVKSTAQSPLDTTSMAEDYDIILLILAWMMYCSKPLETAPSVLWASEASKP